jgi:release factor glutamine methyltransferase
VPECDAAVRATISQALSTSGIDPREARLLLAEATGFSQASVLAYPERMLPAEAEVRFLDWSRRRRAGEPVAYLLGRREFYGLALAVNPAVLIPRPETELLVELALERLARNTEAAVLDLGTGSGAVALAVRHLRPRARVVAVEASAAALEVARRNAARLDLEIDFRHGRWFAPLGAEFFSLILANPPYVAARDPHLTQGDLRFEPRQALVAGEDGLDAIREIARTVCTYLEPGAWFLCEHGVGQEAAVRGLLEAAGLAEVATWRDLAGIGRVSGGRAALTRSGAEA